MKFGPHICIYKPWKTLESHLIGNNLQQMTILTYLYILYMKIFDHRMLSALGPRPCTSIQTLFSNIFFTETVWPIKDKSNAGLFGEGRT